MIGQYGPVLELHAVDGMPVLFADADSVASSLDELLHALPELASNATESEVRWLGTTAVVLAARMSQWPSQYAIEKYIDYLGPPLSRELSAAFLAGQVDAFDQLRAFDSGGTPVGELLPLLASWAAQHGPGAE